MSIVLTIDIISTAVPISANRGQQHIYESSTSSSHLLLMNYSSLIAVFVR